MSVKEVTALRKSGRLKEALNLALNDVKESRDDYSLSALFWVYRDMALEKYNDNSLDEARSCLRYAQDIFAELYDDTGYAETALKSLQRKLTPNFQVVESASERSNNGEVDEAYRVVSQLNSEQSLDPLLHESFGWIIYRYLKEQYVQIGSFTTRRILAEYMKLDNERPSLLHSTMLNLASHISETYKDFNFLSFLKLWNPKNFTGKDFVESHKDDKVFASLTERLMIRCFDLGFKLDDVIEAFTLNERITRTMVQNVFSKWSYFKIYHKSIQKDPTLLESISSYLSDIQMCEIRNEFHSRILSTLIWSLNANNVTVFAAMFESWGLNNFMPEDWERQKSNDNPKVEFLSLVEKAINKYLESLEKQYDHASDGFISLLSRASDTYQDKDQYGRYQALIMFHKGKKEEAIEKYKKLLCNLDKYYVWQELSEMVDDKSLKKSALCKALSMGEQDEYLGKLHLSLARLLIVEGLHAEAKKELELFHNTCTKNGWSLGNEYGLLVKQVDQNVTATKSNEEFYDTNKTFAEDFAYASFEIVPMAIVDMFKDDKGRIKVVMNDGKGCEISAVKKKFSALKDCHSGQMFNVRFKESTRTVGSKCVPLTVSASAEPDWECFPIVCGVIDYVNTQKHIYHIIEPGSMEVIFCKYQRQEFKEGKFIRFRLFERKSKEGKRLEAICLQSVRKEDALASFKHRIVAVDHVNEEKGLFHFVLGPGLLSGIVRFNDTEVRPKVGDCVELYYYVKLNKEHVKKIIPLLVNETTEINANCVRFVMGQLNVSKNSNGDDFGFVCDYYVPSSVLSSYHVGDGDEVEAKAIYTGDGKWRVFEMKKVE